MKLGLAQGAWPFAILLPGSLKAQPGVYLEFPLLFQYSEKKTKARVVQQQENGH